MLFCPEIFWCKPILQWYLALVLKERHPAGHFIEIPKQCISTQAAAGFSSSDCSPEQRNVFFGKTQKAFAFQFIIEKVGQNKRKPKKFGQPIIIVLLNSTMHIYI
jgi:hypothetical protein